MSKSQESQNSGEQVQIGRDDSTNFQTRVTGDGQTIIGENITIYKDRD